MPLETGGQRRQPAGARPSLVALAGVTGTW
jgi:hypothetical protein